MLSEPGFRPSFQAFDGLTEGCYAFVDEDDGFQAGEDALGKAQAILPSALMAALRAAACAIASSRPLSKISISSRLSSSESPVILRRTDLEVVRPARWVHWSS